MVFAVAQTLPLVTALPPADPTLGGLLPAPHPFGPLLVVGYPHNILNGMNDPAEWVGWTTDGAQFGYCEQGSGRSADDTFCLFQGRDGTFEKRTSDDAHGNTSSANARAIEAWLRDNGIQRMGRTSEVSLTPPALKATWAFPDITLTVARIDTTQTVGAFVRVGGSVDSEPPVFPLTLGDPFERPGLPANFAVMNGMAVSPNGTELGMVAHFFSCEWCDSFLPRRITLARLASQIYNDAGFRHHQKKEWMRAAELFARATGADPSAALPPYNLACALARQGDARTESVLRLAIARGGPEVAARARKDADFESLREQPWFRALTSPPARARANSP
jgi:hypothetical protein